MVISLKVIYLSLKSEAAGKCEATGDGVDSVLHIYDAATGSTTNLGLATEGNISTVTRAHVAAAPFAHQHLEPTWHGRPESSMARMDSQP